ncbi:hypothetical protein SNE40_017448 [Patella caerulea]|uniref:Mutator-like transposase domain-containing protein n=1 Tax=Patella caerulea TaxID=87958 RepID=A0AAN8JE09_PATCE
MGWGHVLMWPPDMYWTTTVVRLAQMKMMKVMPTGLSNMRPNAQKTLTRLHMPWRLRLLSLFGERSATQTPKLRYRQFLCDGDSKVFQAVSSLSLYGDDVDIVKEDCANHVAKRFGTALRKITGLGRGNKLTEEAIKKLTLYYRISISNNRGNVEGCIRLFGHLLCIQHPPMMPTTTLIAHWDRNCGVNTKKPRS